MEPVISHIEQKGLKIARIVTDNATQFTNTLWKDLMKKYKIKLSHSTAYNPQSNLVERAMRDIGQRLRIKMNTCSDGAYSHHGWSAFIAEIEAEINNTPNDVDIPPNEAWGIDDFDNELPAEKYTINAKYHLKRLQEQKDKRNPPSTTSDELFINKLDIPNDVLIASDGFTWISIDGACADNGSPKAIAGIGICWHPEGKKNISQRITNSNYSLTNNLAEAMALLTAMKIMLFNDVRKLRVISDSYYLTSAVNDTFVKWSENKWKNSANKPVHHKDIFEEILNLKNQFEEFQLVHVYARQTDFGNFTADALARKAVYTEELDITRIDSLTNHQALIRLIKERKEIKHQTNEQRHNKRYGDPRIFQPGELVMITNHAQSSSDKGTSAKLYPKRYGPFVVVSHVGRNCYEVQKIGDKDDRRLINVRQISTYLNLYHLKILRKEPKLRSKFDDRSLRKRIYQFAEHKDLLEKYIKEIETPKKKNVRTFDEMNEGEKLEEFDHIRKKFRKDPTPEGCKQFNIVLTRVIPDQPERENLRKEAENRMRMRKRTKRIDYNENTDLPEDTMNIPKKKYKSVNFIILNLLNREQRMRFTYIFSALPDWGSILPTTEESIHRDYSKDIAKGVQSFFEATSDQTSPSTTPNNTSITEFESST
ncbi:uncharacterized protein LOC135837518 [Planococcus citri]|uniref:uncharacterized protein LOC135837518 n=1 Tax=Planococcus citri TaxID=170843 RepID=UPI0031F8C175